MEWEGDYNSYISEETKKKFGMLNYEKKKKCELCGKEGIEKKDIIGHHLNYYKEKTIWVCRSCHSKWHRDNNAIGTRKEMFLLKKIKEGKLKGKEWEEYSEKFYQLLEEGKI